MDLMVLRNQINTLPNPHTEDRTRIWFICPTQRQRLNDLIDKVERYEKALKEIANPDASEYLSWQDDMTEQGNDLNEWDWFSSIAKIALETKK